jgi:Holliday junction resolvasome RuvABC endonuclease subunit
MKYTITIDDNTKAGSSLLEISKSIAKIYKSVKVSKISEEDEWIASEIDKSIKTGKADKQKVLSRFNIQ